MTKRISQSIARAFVAGVPKKITNTDCDGFSVSLFGNPIAVKFGTRVSIGMCGWFTRTTIDRLNAILEELQSPIRIGSRKGVPHFINTETYFELPFDPWQTYMVASIESATGGASRVAA